jgi:hypothetical protein
MTQQDHDQGTDTRPADAGETDTTRFGMLQEGADTDGEGTGGMVQKQDAGGAGPVEPAADQGGGSGLATGLQSGGTIPGGGPGATAGSIGTGGGSDANRGTGSQKQWDQGQHEESAK